MSVVLPINPDDRVRTYTLTAAQTVVPVPFPFQQNADIKVTRIAVNGTETPLAIPANYTLTGANNPSGGSLTLVVGGTAGEKVRVEGRAVLDRTTSIVRAGAYSSKALDDELDRSRIIQQELAREAGRALKVPFGVTPPAFPASIGEGKTVIGGPGGTLIEGPDGNDIAAAEAAAQAAIAARDLTLGYRDEADADRVAAAASAETALDARDLTLGYRDAAEDHRNDAVAAAAAAASARDLALGYRDEAEADRAAADASASTATTQATTATTQAGLANTARIAAEAAAALAAGIGATFVDQAAAAAATIGGAVTYIEVAGRQWRRVDPLHPRILSAAELVTNGDFASSSGWVLEGTWAIASGVLSATAGAGSNAYRTANATLVNGQRYLMSVNATVTASTFQFHVGGNYAGLFSTSGARWTIMAAGATQFIGLLKGGTSAGTFDNLSLKAIPADAFQSADGAWWARGDLSQTGDIPRAEVTLWRPLETPLSFRTSGFTTHGDGGGATYRRVATEPSHPGKVSVTTLAGTVFWYEIVPMAGRITMRQLGCVADGAISYTALADETLNPTGTGVMSGTDNYTAVRNAYACANALNVELFVDGFFYVRVPDVSSQNILEVTNLKMRGFGREKSGILFGGSQNYTAVGQSANTMIGPPSRYSASWTRNLYDHFIIEGVTLMGAWWREVQMGDRTWTAPQPYRVHGPSPHNYRFVRIRDCNIWDVMGFGIYGKSNMKQICTGNDLRRICGDGIRGEDVSDYTVRDNFIFGCDDDAITNPKPDDLPNTTRPRAERALITGNTIINSEGLLVLAPAHCIVSNNKMVRCYGTSLSVFAMNANIIDMGEGGFRTTIVANNIVENQLRASNRASPPDGTWGADTHAYNINGAAAAAINTTYPIGETISSDMTLPWHVVSGAGMPWGALHLNDAAGAATTPAEQASGFRTSGLIVQGNIAIRTLPAATNYSDWGVGTRFTRWGFDNPAVGDEHFAINGYRFGGAFSAAVVSGNQAENFAQDGFRLDDSDANMAYRSFLISGNTIKNVRFGIRTSAVAENHHDITIHGNLIDCDPYLRATERVKTTGNHGKWSTTSAAAPACVALTFTRGAKIISNVFANAANAVLAEGGAVENLAHTVMRDNIGIIDFDSVSTTDTSHTNNRGLGRILRAGSAITYDIRDLNPASADYLKTRAGMVQALNNVPTSGHYVFGHRVERVAGGYWQRLTTGTQHTLGTDWVLVS